MSSDRSFKEFLKSGAPLSRVVILLAAGVLLVLCGFLFSSENTEQVSPEDDMAQLCSQIEGVGECKVRVTYGEDGEVFGVAVLCDGANDPKVKARLVDLFGSIYGIGANRITVLKINDKS